jgi:hypothetical protein
MKFPFWESMIQRLEKYPTQTNFDTAANLASEPTTCLIGEGIGFGHRDYAESLTPAALDIFENFNKNRFGFPPDLSKAKALLKRAQRLRKLYK